MSVHFEATDSAASATPASTSKPNRLLALDFTRGIALLGITLVNVYMFALPFGTFMLHGGTRRDGLLNEFAYGFMWTMCAGRFYPLFSLMFGIGMMFILMKFVRGEGGASAQVSLQEPRPLPAGFAWAFVRRLAVLALIGVLHFAFIWYGDILFFYACVGLLLLVTPGFRLRTILILAGVAYGVSLLLITLMSLGGMLVDFPTGKPPILPESMQALPPMQRLFEAFGKGLVQGGPEDPIWMGVELEVFSQGPMSQAIVFRLFMYAVGFGFMVFGMLGTIVAMFLVGAAMVRGNFFSPAFRKWHVRLATFGYGGGVVISLLAYGMDQVIGWDGEWLSGMAQPIVGPWMAVGLLCCFLLLVPWVLDNCVPAVKGFVNAVARMGQMGLSNYITMSLLATFVTNWWGLGMYGKLSLFEMMLLAIGLWVVLLVTSNIWLRFFKMGPLEWVWKSATYWKPAGKTAEKTGGEAGAA
jgi:uncharacterized protein